MINNQKVYCPVCGDTCNEPSLFKYSATQAAAYFCPPTRNMDRYRRLVNSVRKLWKGEECFIYRCSTCQFAFGYPFIGGDEEFYSILHEQKGYPKWRWDYDVAIKEIFKICDGGKIMDIGAGEGDFLKKLGSDWQPYAVEASEKTRKILTQRGLCVFQSMKEAVENEAGTFRVVTLFQALEHIADFRAILTLCRRLLCKEGVIFITVPDANAMIRQEQLLGCPDMPPNHINKWTPGSLSKVLNNVGFNPQKPIFEPWALRHLLDAVHLKILSEACRPGSISANIYRISNKRIRVPLLACLGLLEVIPLVPLVKEVCKGGAFGMMGIAK